MKYVAFLDILGFKEKLRTLNQYGAQKYIEDFSSTIYDVWCKKPRNLINGYIVSDSVIIYSSSISIEALQQMIMIIDDICKEEFKNNSILVRGAIAKGEFNKLEARELPSLGKGLVVGQAYVDAYLLEGTVKTLGIVLSQDVCEDYLNAYLPGKDLLQEEINGNKYNVYRYLDADFLLEPENLSTFIALASKSDWLPHFYNAMYFALKNEKSEKKGLQVFRNIVKEINGESPSENWRVLDKFIKNAFDAEVIGAFQTRFLKFLREHIC